MTLFVVLLTFVIGLCLSSDSAGSKGSKSSSKGSSDSASSDECNPDDWELRYIASSAKLRLYNSCNSRQSFEVGMTSLIEYDSDDISTSNQITSFESLNGEWDNNDIGDDNEYEGNAVLSNVFRVYNILEEGVNFVLETIFFVNDDNSIYNKSVAVNQYSLKWNVDISNWPFLNANNTLKLCINITTENARKGRISSSDSRDSRDSKGSKSSKDRRLLSRDSDSSDSDDDRYNLNEWQIGDFGLETLDYANCQGAEEEDKQIAVNIEDEKIENENERNICFSFDYCESGTISYDPIVKFFENSVDDNSGLTVGEQAAIGISVSILVLIICLCIVCFIYKKKNCGKSYQGLLDGNDGNKKRNNNYGEVAPDQEN